MGKVFFIAIALVGGMAFFSCHKSAGVNATNLALLQHKWSITSENGGYPFVAPHSSYNEFDPYIGWYNGTTSA